MAKLKNELIVIPKIKIHPSKIILYKEYHYSHFKPSRKLADNNETYLIQVVKRGKIELQRISSKFINSTRSGQGELSKQAIKRLKLSIEYLLLLNKPKTGKSGNTGRHYKNNITFITLTLPSKQIHTDKEIKEKCLNHFMIEMHKFWRIDNYVWRAEYQKNNNIHFHILVNRFIPYADIRTRWNRIINKLGYVDKYRENMNEWHKEGFKAREDLKNTWSIEKQKQAYQKGKKENWENPNSTDIHSIKNITNLKSYLTKYLTKQDQEKNKPQITDPEELKNIGRLWAASTILSKISGADTELDTQLGNNLEQLEEHFKNSFFRSDYFTVIDINLEQLASVKCLELLNLFYSYLHSEFNYSHQFEF